MKRPTIGMIVALTHQDREASAHLQCDHKAVQAILAAGGQVQLLPLLTESCKQEALSALTEMLEGIDGLLLVDQTPADQAEGGGALWWESSTYQLACRQGIPILGIGDGASQLALASGGRLHAQKKERNQAAHEAPSASPTLVMVDRSYFSLCIPESFAPLLQAEGDVLTVESPLQGQVKELAAPFTPWAWSCNDASIVAFGTPLDETGWYAIGTSLPIQAEHLCKALFSRLLTGSFVAAARERATRRREVEDFFQGSSEVVLSRLFASASSPLRSLALQAGGVRGA